MMNNSTNNEVNGNGRNNHLMLRPEDEVEEAMDDYSSSSDSDLSSFESIAERDEEAEVREMTTKETRRVFFGRIAMFTILLFTTCAVTGTTYIRLTNDQKGEFKTAFEQWSRTIGDEAVEQQKNIRDAVSGFATAISASADALNATWPYYTLHLFETYARNYRQQSRMEFIAQGNIVKDAERTQYENWADEHYEDMVQEGYIIDTGARVEINTSTYNDFIMVYSGEDRTPVPDKDREEYYAVWSWSPPPISYAMVNWNFINVPEFRTAVEAMMTLKNETVFTKVKTYNYVIDTVMTQEDHEALHKELTDSSTEHPHSLVYHPIHVDATDTQSEIVGIVGGGVAWDAALRGLLPDDVKGIDVVISNSCNQSYTYEIDGKDAIFQGEGDLHETEFSAYRKSRKLDESTHPQFKSTPGHCRFKIDIYPTEAFQIRFYDDVPIRYAALVFFTFLLMCSAFLTYDTLVRRRNDKIVANAARSNGIVSSMFPEQFRDRLIGRDASNELRKSNGRRGGNLKNFMMQGASTRRGSSPGDSDSKPLADLFLETTVLFADITGFTAWSSVREPTQVFTLLETVYAAFDKIAKRRRVFKVETVGDCYVAATGLPDPRPDHAVAMARFANEILEKMDVLTKELETTLGPDTADLSIRLGMHSGPVTGGVLRGERSRFQLFGDTMNTASRMETSGERGRVQVSKQTADLLDSAGKGAWLVQREEKIVAKGKGDLQTFWLQVGSKNRSMGSSVHSDVDREKEADTTDRRLSRALQCSASFRHFPERTARLVGWNVDILQRLLKQIIARRNATSSKVSEIMLECPLDGRSGSTPLQEVKEIIMLPKFQSKATKRQEDPNRIELPPKVLDQLTEYVSCIANMYRDNAFHNFDHCSHVVMSVTKLMSRIVAPNDIINEEEVADDSTMVRRKTLHDHTYGITSDPLTQFACAFSALIHDVDHTGVPNPKVCEECPALAMKYESRSVAEQNSLDLAWDLLMQHRFIDLRSAIYSTQTELRRFRSLVVNSVMATDLGDKELKELRNARWDKAFKDQENDTVPQNIVATEENERDGVNRKATIVIEHLIQASDVSHTMQHWHIYRKWNERLFEEMYRAYKDGRAKTDPSEFWYKGEMGFFDFYIIPLAKKLKNCGVFGKSSDEFLDYATNNRKEWEQRGQEITASMTEELSKKGWST